MVSGLGDLLPTNLPLSSPKGDKNSFFKTKEDSGGEKSGFDSVMSREMGAKDAKRMKDTDEAGPMQAEDAEPQPVARDRSTKTLREEAADVDSAVRWDKLESEQNVQAPTVLSTEQAAMLKFMVSMEDELGISPEEILQAMTSLQEEELSLTPEESMAKVLAGMDLEPEEVERAAELYSEMLVSTGYGGAYAMAVQEAAKAAKSVPVSDMNFQVVTKEQLRKDQLASNVNKIRTSFFETDDLARGQWKSQLGSDKVRPQSKVVVPDLMDLEYAGKPAAQNPQVNELSADAAREGLEREAPLDEMLNLMEQPQSDMDVDLEGFNMKPKIDVSGQEMQKASAEISSNAANPSLPNFGLGGRFGSESQTSDFSSSATADGESIDPARLSEAEGGEFEQTLQAGAAFGAASSAKAAAGVKAAGENQQQQTVNVENVQDLVDQAQVMIRKGGGTMKVQLNPEGLGQVQLKVDVQNGGVNIQMVTDHSEAKRILEKGLDELRTNLAMQKMNLESLKVDVSNESMSRDMRQNEQDMAREYARDFMGKMRDENQSSRQDSMPAPFQRYFNQSRRQIDPIEVASANSQGRGKSANSRLHLVA